MNADGLDISLPVHFLSEVIKYDHGDNIIQWTCQFNTHLCNIESRIKKTDGNETMLCLSVSKPGKGVNCSNALQIIISNVHKNDEIQCSIGLPDVQTQNNCLKRKRGRPRKSDSSERNQVTLLPETNGKRYSLRGVRIAESIMNAEKGIDGDSNSLEAHSESGNQINKHTGISKMHKDLNHLEENEDNLKTTLGAGTEEESRNKHGLYQHTLYLQECSEGSFKDPTYDGRISNKQQNKSDELDDESDDSIIDSRQNTNYCQRCRKTYKNFQTLRNHIRYVHKTPGQQNHCKLCPAKFKHMSVLKQHIDEIHNKKISFTCAVCKKEFARRNQYNRHMLCHSEDKSKRLKCPHCEKRFSFKYNLSRHIELVHKPSTESFHCSYCGKGFNLKAAMVSHVQQVHFNIYPFQCSVDDCKMGFSRQKHLLEHMQQSHSDVAFKPKQYKRGRFKYGRTDEDLFFCSHCRISFCYKAKLVEHMHFAHNNAFPFVCNECSQGFVEKTYLLHHLKHAHNQNVDDKAVEEAGKEDAEVSENLDEERAGNYKIIMVDEAGEVLQICQPINTETSATLEVHTNLNININLNLYALYWVDKNSW